MRRIVGQSEFGWTEHWRSHASGSAGRTLPDKSEASQETGGEHPPHQGKDLPDSILFATLDLIGCGYLVIDGHRRVVAANDLARDLLHRELGGSCGRGNDGMSLTSDFRRLTDRAGTRFPFTPVPWAEVPRETGRPLILKQIGDIQRDGCSIIVMLDLEDRPGPNGQTLQRMFGLTAAESSLAISLIRGEAPCDVARERHLSKTTVRSHLASLFAKTQTCRQAELVSLLSSVSIMA